MTGTWGWHQGGILLRSPHVVALRHVQASSVITPDPAGAPSLPVCGVSVRGGHLSTCQISSELVFCTWDFLTKSVPKMAGHEYTFAKSPNTPLLNLGYRVRLLSLVSSGSAYWGIGCLKRDCWGTQLFMKRNSVYLAFIFGGAIVGERVCPITVGL
jgi:hypothetical protein